MAAEASGRGDAARQGAMQAVDAAGVVSQAQQQAPDAAGAVTTASRRAEDLTDRAADRLRDIDRGGL